MKKIDYDALEMLKALESAVDTAGKLGFTYIDEQIENLAEGLAKRYNLELWAFYPPYQN